MRIAHTVVLAFLLVAPGCGTKEKTSSSSTVAKDAPALTKKPRKGRDGIAVPNKKVVVEPVALELWHTYRGKEKAAIEKVAKTISSAGRGVKLTVKALPYDGFLDKLRITIKNGRGPDLFIFAHNKLGPWTRAGIVEPLTTKVDRAKLKMFVPSAVRALVYRRSLYGLPLALKPLALFYNKAHLAKVPESMEVLIVELRKKQSNALHGIVYNAGMLFFHAQWIHGYGGVVLDKEARPRLDTQAQIQALAFARSLHQEHKILPRGMTGNMVTSLFNQGNAVTALNGPWFMAEIAKGVDYGVAPIPSVRNNPARPFMSIEGVFVSSASKSKATAIKTAMLLAGAESAKIRLETGRQTVAHKATLDATQDPFIKVFRQAAAQAIATDARPEMDETFGPMNTAISAGIYRDKANLKALLTKAQATTVKTIFRLKK